MALMTGNIVTKKDSAIVTKNDVCDSAILLSLLQSA
jgi:hypothetical protein